MTDVVEERPFYEAAMARRAPQPPASRVPVYAICAAAFVIGFVAFFIGGVPDRPVAEMDRAVAYMLGYKLGSQAVYALVVGLAGMVILSLTQARKLRQRSSGEDFLGPFLCALGGGLAAVALIIALGAPAMAANKIANPIRAAYLEAGNADAMAIDRDVMQIADGGVLSGANLQNDPGYRKAGVKVGKLRAVVVKYRKREADRFTATRGQLAKAIKSVGQRKRILAEFDAEMAQARPLLDQYWALQNKGVDHMAASLAQLRASPGQWQNGAYYFYRPADLTRFQATVDNGLRLKTETDAVRHKLMNLSRPAEQQSR